MQQIIDKMRSRQTSVKTPVRELNIRQHLENFDRRERSMNDISVELRRIRDDLVRNGYQQYAS